ncbi:glycosyltransferase [Amycolatopsis carbonis]|uniref:Glycosyltransferase n=1 Tax=Amycolatopsis carbonis TaxID=715471 RepID=A0A9Y2IDH5_9PSEU|nr:glycosyltransferase [Amycolatopsis sp. 2-15]WIX76503.1 glycosyltransferase [Amycolatopsis sp. 2-15]
MINAVAVVVPARNEAALLPRCLDAVRRSLALLPAGTARTVIVVADRCTDATPAIARRHGARVVTTTRFGTIGAVRTSAAAWRSTSSTPSRLRAWCCSTPTRTPR